MKKSTLLALTTAATLAVLPLSASRADRASDEREGAQTAAHMEEQMEAFTTIETVHLIQALELETEDAGRFAALMGQTHRAMRENTMRRAQLLRTLETRLEANAPEADVARLVGEVRSLDEAFLQNRKESFDRIAQLLGTQKTARYLVLRSKQRLVAREGRDGGNRQGGQRAQGSRRGQRSEGANRNRRSAQSEE